MSRSGTVRSEISGATQGGLSTGFRSGGMTGAGVLTIEGRTEPRRIADVEIVIPVYNEQADLEVSIRRLHAYLSERFQFSWLVTIADNASRDLTWAIACRLAADLDGVRAVHLDEKGRGRALRATWSASTAAVVAYMDVDLATDLDGLLPLVAPLLSGHSDIAIGSRLAPGARVVRGPKREVISRSYNLILKAALRNDFSDAQCGFKAVRADVAQALLPLIEDNGWFFDTELLVLAEHNGLRIHEVPVDWVDDPDSRVEVISTAKDDLKGVWRMMRRFAAGGGELPDDALRDAFDQGRSGRLDHRHIHYPAWTAPLRLIRKLMRYAAVSAIATTVSLTVLGVLVATGATTPGWANVIATAVGTVPSFELNRRWVWAKTGHRSWRRELGPFCALSFAGLALSTVAVRAATGWTSSAGLGPTARTLAAEAASIATFGSMWVGQYLILDRLLFARPMTPKAE